jgi:hypothetical protein
VYPRGNQPTTNDSLILVAFDRKERANELARSHEEENDFEMGTEIATEVEQHVLRMTGYAFE